VKDKTLTELFNTIGSTDKHTRHKYDGLYGPLLAHKRETAKKVIEVGVSDFGGGDFHALGHYFPNAEVHGVDIIPLEQGGLYTKVAPEHEASNVVFHLMDGYDPPQLDSTFGDTKWDFALDDGPHSTESQIIFLNYFHNRLAPNGILIIEDIQGGINGDAVQRLYDNFVGDKRFLSFIDRSRGAAPDDILAMYMPY
jgi:hypothetical protein